MHLTGSTTNIYRKIRDTQILPTDTRQQIREKLARIAIDEMYQFVGLLDADGMVLEANRASLEGAGVTEADVLGKPFWECFWWAVSEEGRQRVRQAIARAAAGEFVRYDVEVYGRSRGAETIVVDFSLIPIRDERGEVVFIVPEGRDITEKKAYEKNIAQKNADLQALLERIRELDDIKTRFFANVSHELRTPLALIIGPAERLAAAATKGPEAQRESAGIIARNARLLLKHVNDLLDISRLEAGELKIELIDTDVAELVRFVASHFEALARERGIDLRLELSGPSGDPQPPVCAVDAGRMQRVVMNLLSNAFKFAPERGTVRCRVEALGAEIRLSVDDSGPGVPPAMRQAIFERFRQGDQPGSGQVPGTGLGLAIARELVGLHKGHIEVVESDLGGASFQVTLPRRVPGTSQQHQAAMAQTLDRSTLQGVLEELRPAAPGSDSPAAADSAAGPARPRVLVVEDNPDMNRFIADCLEPEHEVIGAFDGREGLERALAEQPDLIVTDVMMPRMSGEALIRELRRHPELQETPILLLSARTDEELRIRLLEAGAQDFVTKPFAERELMVRARNLVEAKLGRDALRDVERLKREATEDASRQLQVQHHFMTELFQRSPSFMAVLRGPDHVVELANPAYFSVIGHRDVIGKPLLEAMPELEGQPLLRVLDGVLETGEAFRGKSMTLRLQRSSGAPLEERFVDFVYQPLRNAAGRTTGVFVEGHDVTEHRRAEEALREADRRKDEFLATLAHELRNPLAPIRHAAQIIRNPGAGDAQVRWSHQVIDRQVEHMARLLDDLLEVSRITRGILELRRERLVLQDALAAAVDTARPLIEARGHRLVVDGPEQTVEVEADPVRLAQIFSNLLSNAAKYTGRGGTIRVRTVVGDGTVSTAVQDNGIGISPQQLPRVFEMFSQAASALERSEGGLGIGLSLVRGLVRLHGGSIEARSPGLGKGSEFIVTLPLADARPPSQAAPAATDAPTGSTALRVLVADDNRDSADGCAMLLRLAGHDVRTAYSGREALALAADFVPQVALLDIGMPGMNGYEVARAIRRQPWGRDMRLVAITGWGQDEDKRQAQQAGFDDHLVKPVDLAALQTMLAEPRSRD